MIKKKKGYLGLTVNEESTSFAKLFWGELGSFQVRWCAIIKISTLCLYTWLPDIEIKNHEGYTTKSYPG